MLRSCVASPLECFKRVVKSHKRFQGIQEVEGWQQGSWSLQLLRDFSTMLAVVVTAVRWVFLVSVSKPNKPNGVGWKHPLVCHWCFIWDEELFVPISHAIIIVFSPFPSFFRYQYLHFSFSHLPILTFYFCWHWPWSSFKNYFVYLLYVKYPYSHSGFYGMRGEPDQSLTFCRIKWKSLKVKLPWQLAQQGLD